MDSESNLGQLSPDGLWRWDGSRWVPAGGTPWVAGPDPTGGRRIGASLVMLGLVPVLVPALALFFWFTVQTIQNGSKGDQWSYSQLVNRAATHEVARVVIDGTTATVTAADGSRLQVDLGDSTSTFASQLSRDGVKVSRQAWIVTLWPQILWSAVIVLVVAASMVFTIQRLFRWRPRRHGPVLSPVRIIVFAGVLLTAEIVLSLSVISWFSFRSIELGDTGPRWTYSQLTEKAAAHQVSRLVIRGADATATGRDGLLHAVQLRGANASLADRMTGYGVDVAYQEPDPGSLVVWWVTAGLVALVLAGGVAYTGLRLRRERPAAGSATAP